MIARSISMMLALIGLGLAADGRVARDGVGALGGGDGPDGSLIASLMAGLMETAGPNAAYAQGAKDCLFTPGLTLRQLRRCLRRVSWNPNNNSDINIDPVITPDGRYIAFTSQDNLDGNPDDVDPEQSEEEPFPVANRDIFLIDLQTGELRRVSLTEAGDLARVPTPDPDDGDALQLADSDSPAVSGNGQLVAFVTDGALLPEQDTNRSGDVYLKDLSNGGELRLVSATAEGRPALGGVPLNQAGSSFPIVAMSDNGRFVAFMTAAAIDSERDHNGTLDVYVKDLRMKRFFLASIDDGRQAAGVADPPVSNDSPPTPTDPAIDISGNGRFVAFTTLAPISSADHNTEADVYVWDRHRPHEAPILASGGVEPPDGFDPDNQGALSSSPALSFSGRFIAFDSHAALVHGDTNNVSDVYRYNRVKRSLRRVSVDSEGRQTAVNVDGSFDPAISATGRFVAFSSAASDLLVGDTNLGATDRTTSIDTQLPEDIFVKDLRTGAITRASLDEDGIESDGTSFSPSLSADGEVITFVTEDAIILDPDPDNLRQGDSVVVTGVAFQPPPSLETPGAPAGAVSIERNFQVSPGGGIFIPEPDPLGRLDFALRNSIEHQNDQDWFRVHLFEDKTYVIDLEGRPTRQGSLDDPLLRILVPKIAGVDVDLADEDDDCGVGLNARLVFRPPVEGTYFISAESFGAATGTYRLLVRETSDPGCDP